MGSVCGHSIPSGMDGTRLALESDRTCSSSGFAPALERPCWPAEESPFARVAPPASCSPHLPSCEFVGVLQDIRSSPGGPESCLVQFRVAGAVGSESTVQLVQGRAPLPECEVSRFPMMRVSSMNEKCLKEQCIYDL
jgi:hypothetical protein